MKKTNVLHITPHLGGGVGSVVLNWMLKDDSKNFNYTVLALDKNNNKDWISVNYIRPNVKILDGIYFQDNYEKLLEIYVSKADVVIIHWWNHPLLYDLMINRKLPPCRLMMWNHVSGLYPPYVMTHNDIAFCDKFVFTSPVSYEAEEIKSLPKKDLKKLDVNWSTIGVESFKNIKRLEHKDFIVGFTGTVDFGKLNSAYIDMCSSVKHKDIKFVVCSGDSQQHLIDEAKNKGVYERFSFMGRVPDVVPYVSSFDVFGYPLHPKHFATCEQAIGEAMMAGAVPVVLNNPTERYIVKHMENGIVANSKDEYAKAIDFLYENPNELKRMQKNAMKYASKLYDINKTIKKWHQLIKKEMKLPKRGRVWNPDFQKRLSPEELYIASQGRHANCFKSYLNAGNFAELNEAKEKIKQQYRTNAMYLSKSKGSVLQYLHFFKESVVLQEWGRLVEDMKTGL